jgi:hypothetical protein
MLRRVLERVERLEERLDRGLRELPRLKEFDFERFVPPQWREFMPRFQDRDFKFDFRRGEKEPGEKKAAPEKEEKKPEKKPEKKVEKQEEKQEEKKEEKKKPKKEDSGNF